MKTIHLSNRPIRGVKTIDAMRGGLKRLVAGRIVVCHVGYLSHNQVEVAKKYAKEVRYV